MSQHPAPSRQAKHPPQAHPGDEGIAMAKALWAKYLRVVELDYSEEELQDALTSDTDRSTLFEKHIRKTLLYDLHDQLMKVKGFDMRTYDRAILETARRYKLGHMKEDAGPKAVRWRAAYKEWLSRYTSNKQHKKDSQSLAADAKTMNYFKHTYTRYHDMVNSDVIEKAIKDRPLQDELRSRLYARKTCVGCADEDHRLWPVDTDEGIGEGNTKYTAPNLFANRVHTSCVEREHPKKGSWSVLDDDLLGKFKAMRRLEGGPAAAGHLERSAMRQPHYKIKPDSERIDVEYRTSSQRARGAVAWERMHMEDHHNTFFKEYSSLSPPELRNRIALDSKSLSKNAAVSQIVEHVGEFLTHNLPANAKDIAATEHMCEKSYDKLMAKQKKDKAEEMLTLATERLDSVSMPQHAYDRLQAKHAEDKTGELFDLDIKMLGGLNIEQLESIIDHYEKDRIPGDLCEPDPCEPENWSREQFLIPYFTRAEVVGIRKEAAETVLRRKERLANNRYRQNWWHKARGKCKESGLTLESLHRSIFAEYNKLHFRTLDYLVENKESNLDVTGTLYKLKEDFVFKSDDVYAFTADIRRKTCEGIWKHLGHQAPFCFLLEERRQKDRLEIQLRNLKTQFRETETELHGLKKQGSADLDVEQWSKKVEIKESVNKKRELEIHDKGLRIKEKEKELAQMPDESAADIGCGDALRKELFKALLKTTFGAAMEEYCHMSYSALETKKNSTCKELCDQESWSLNDFKHHERLDIAAMPVYQDCLKALSERFTVEWLIHDTDKREKRDRLLPSHYDPEQISKLVTKCFNAWEYHFWSRKIDNKRGHRSSEASSRSGDHKRQKFEGADVPEPRGSVGLAAGHGDVLEGTDTYMEGTERNS